MKTIIELNETLIKEVMQISNAHSQSEAINIALQNFVMFHKRRNMKSLFGKVIWEGDVKKMRRL